MNNQIDDDLVLDGLTPEDLIESGRKFRKQLLDSLTPQERLARIPVDALVRFIQQDEHLLRQIIANTPPQTRLLGMSLAQRLTGMTTEELTTLLDLVEHQLRQIKAEK